MLRTKKESSDPCLPRLRSGRPFEPSTPFSSVARRIGAARHRHRVPPSTARCAGPRSPGFQPGREELLCNVGAPDGRRRPRGRPRSSRSVEAAHRPDGAHLQRLAQHVPHPLVCAALSITAVEQFDWPPLQPAPGPVRSSARQSSREVTPSDEDLQACGVADAGRHHAPARGRPGRLDRQALTRPTGCTAGDREATDERPDQAAQGQGPRARGGPGEGSRRTHRVHHRTVDTLGQMLRAGTIT
jgi:uncharacterized protein (DUF2249 family)